MLTSEWQKRLDDFVYPPSHTYCIKDMTPSGSLAKRAAIVKAYIQRCEHRDSALEVGFNKGYFLHLFGRHFENVDGCEPWREYFDLVDALRRDLAWPNIRSLHCGSFLDMPPADDGKPYDFIFLGNCMHYLFRETGSFGFVEALGRRCRGGLLIEGFTSLDGDDEYMIGSRRKWPIDMQQAFNDAAFDQAMAPWFRLVDTQRSPTGAARRFMYFQRISHAGEATP